MSGQTLPEQLRWLHGLAVDELAQAHYDGKTAFLLHAAKRLSALERTLAKVRRELINAQPHIGEVDFHGIIDPHIDVALEAIEGAIGPEPKVAESHGDDEKRREEDQ